MTIHKCLNQAIREEADASQLVQLRNHVESIASTAASESTAMLLRSIVPRIEEVAVAARERAGLARDIVEQDLEKEEQNGQV